MVFQLNLALAVANLIKEPILNLILLVSLFFVTARLIKKIKIRNLVKN